MSSDQPILANLSNQEWILVFAGFGLLGFLWWITHSILNDVGPILDQGAKDLASHLKESDWNKARRERKEIKRLEQLVAKEKLEKELRKIRRD